MPAAPFVVNVGTLRRRDGNVEHVHVEGPLDDLVVTGSRVPAGAEVAAEVTLESVPGGVVVHGTVAAPFLADCRRCLGPVEGTISVEVREVFEETPDPEETYPLAGALLDLAPMVRDAVLLELPQAVLCAESCQGLCPTCGANRNEGECSCPPAEPDPRWAALDALRRQDEITEET